MLQNKYVKTLHLICAFVVLGAIPSDALAHGRMATPSNDDLVTKIKKLEERVVTSYNMKLSLGGWVNRAIQLADNGFHSNLSHVSPGNVISNLQVTGMLDPIPGYTLGTQLQIDFNQNGTISRTSGQSLVDIGRAQTNQQSEGAISVRQAEITLDSKVWGKLSAGRGYTASAGVIYYTDLSGTYVFLHPYSSIGGISFRNKKTGTPYNPNPLDPKTTLKPGVVIFEHGDGGSIYGRNDRIRYDSPNFYGFNISTSHSYQNIGNLFDVALKFAAPLGGTIVVAQTSWARNHTRDKYNGLNLQTNGLTLQALGMALAMDPDSVDIDDLKGPKFDTYNYAVGVLTPFSYTGKEMTGLNFHFSGAHRKWKVHNQEDGHAWQGKIGYLDYFSSIGKTAFIASYGQWKAMDVDFYDPRHTMLGTNWGTGVVQNIDVVGTLLYLRYDNYKFKSKHSHQKFKDVNVVYAGALIKL
jgi:predicted porin